MKKSILILTAAFAAFATAASAADGEPSASRQLANDLYKEVAVGPYGLRVRSINGVVRLTGSVGTVRDYRVAQRMADEAFGGFDVRNDLNVVIR